MHAYFFSLGKLLTWQMHHCIIDRNSTTARAWQNCLDGWFAIWKYIHCKWLLPAPQDTEYHTGTRVFYLYPITQLHVLSIWIPSHSYTCLLPVSHHTVHVSSTWGASSYWAAQSGSVGSPNMVCLVTEPLWADRTELTKCSLSKYTQCSDQSRHWAYVSHCLCVITCLVTDQISSDGNWASHSDQSRHWSYVSLCLYVIICLVTDEISSDRNWAKNS